MTVDGLKKTGIYFTGFKWVVQAHYPKIVDYVEETLEGAATDALKEFISKHTKAGANVHVSEHKWVEVFIGSSWHPALDEDGRRIAPPGPPLKGGHE